MPFWNNTSPALDFNEVPENQSPFQPGGLVRLKCGGPVMVLGHKGESGQYHHDKEQVKAHTHWVCYWDNDRYLQSATIDEVTLVEASLEDVTEDNGD